MKKTHKNKNKQNFSDKEKIPPSENTFRDDKELQEKIIGRIIAKILERDVEKILASFSDEKNKGLNTTDKPEETNNQGDLAMLKTIEDFKAHFGQIINEINDNIDENMMYNDFDEFESDIDQEIFGQGDQETYSLEELLALFAPAKTMENIVLLEGNTRSTSAENIEEHKLQVKLPDNEANFDESLNIELQTPLNIPLHLIIINNQEERVLEQIIPANISAFEVSLKGCSPGRYYWKLYAKIMPDTSSNIVRVFFIKRHLDPYK